MTVSIKVYSDYVCPYCFLAEKPLEEAIQNKDVTVELMPFMGKRYIRRGCYLCGRIKRIGETNRFALVQSSLVEKSTRITINFSFIPSF